jgi:DNA-binding response OmpR family regulator
MRILLIDDDEVLMQALADRLIQERYAVDIALDGNTALDYLQLFKYDLIILDLMLPDGNGIDFCQVFRKEGYENPLLMLTARASTAEKVKALDAGADDYVVKPFDFDELCARIRALLRREHQALPSVLQWGNLRLDPSTCETFFKETPVHLTPKEFALIELFLRHPNRVYSLDAIIEDLWSFEDPPSEDAVRTHIKGLRHKLKAVGAPKDMIKTVYGLGYRLKPDGIVQATAQNASSTGDHALATPSPTATSLAVAKAWTQYQDTMKERIAVLETTAAALSTGSLSQELHHHGQANAHKLVGALGSFGFSEGSRLARELEEILYHSASLDPEQISRFSDLVQQLRQSIELPSEEDAISMVNQGTPLLLLISEDVTLSAEIEKAAATQGIRTLVIHQIDQAHSILNATPPPLIFLDSNLLTDNYAELDSLVRAIASESTTLFVMADHPDLKTRLEIVQQGAGQILERLAPAARTDCCCPTGPPGDNR